jgi:hypothetical protein
MTGRPDFLVIRHRQCADRVEGKLSILRVQEGKFKAELEHDVAMLDYDVTREGDHGLVVNYSTIQRNSAGTVTEARSRHRLLLRVGPNGMAVARESLTPWMDLVDQCLAPRARRTGQEPVAVQKGMAILDAIPDRHQVFFDEEKGSLTGVGSVTLRVWGARTERDVRISCHRGSEDGTWRVSGARELPR